MTNLPHNVRSRVSQLEAEAPSSLVAVFSSTGNYLFANRAHETLLGYSPQELTKLTLPQIVHPDDRRHTQLAYMDAVLNGNSIQIGVRLICKDGTFLKVHARAWAYDDAQTGAMVLVGQCSPAPD